MNYPFSQPNIVYQVSFSVFYKDLNHFEALFEEKAIGISSHEISSKTVENMPDDLWTIELLFETKPDLKLIEKQLDSVIVDDPYSAWNLSMQIIEDKDWVKEYQEQLKPLIIDNFFITSSSIKQQPLADKTPIYIEASRAFGTGDHATTSLCIKALNLISTQKITSIFDIGTGSGILSFVAEKIWSESNILACDIDQISVEIAQGNLALNHSNVQFYQNNEQDLLIPDNYQTTKFDLVISNILAQPLIFLSSTIKDITNNGAYVILSGFLDYQLNDVQKSYKNIGFTTMKILRQDDWICLLLKKQL